MQIAVPDMANSRTYAARHRFCEYHSDHPPSQLVTYRMTVRTRPAATLEFQRHEVLLNQAPPAFMIDQLLQQTGDLLYPLQIAFRQPAATPHLINAETIRQRWRQALPYLQTCYGGDMAGNLLQLLTDKIMDSLLSDKLPEHEPFIQCYRLSVITASPVRFIYQGHSFLLTPGAPHATGKDTYSTSWQGTTTGHITREIYYHAVSHIQTRHLLSCSCRLLQYQQQQLQQQEELQITCTAT
ncbi:hypothetical protein [Chitinophaga nivalis]|uniref:Uncharacterized protein n=1 Tax=Chitinophaga nivalis TaxID=2991709 RepID=A0ABT3IT19_9BACT|nr:hypothetical protein [Chitinophaga nivalis]MCW3463183.1 hypothetical protein [Chitinophaga nivalis]MCW3487127.1 hypothetical protein [Chitinophaga nivalis]